MNPSKCFKAGPVFLFLFREPAVKHLPTQGLSPQSTQMSEEPNPVNSCPWENAGNAH